MRAARAARLFSLMRPIIFLVRRIILAIVVVDDKAIECRGFLRALIQEKNCTYHRKIKPSQSKLGQRGIIILVLKDMKTKQNIF